MLFNSISFILIFLPASLLLFFIFGRLHQRLAMVWLVVASLLFYSWLSLQFLVLLVVSILFNFLLGEALEKFSAKKRISSTILICGVAANLLALIYYKYLYGLTGWVHVHVWAKEGQIGSAVLPLGISFFTLTQTGFLIDRQAGVTKAKNFIEYVLFVTFFPHLIAGPILHHREITPQFLKQETYRFNSRNFAIGLTIFALGLLKKVAIADWFNGFVLQGFSDTHDLSRMTAWRCVISFFIQLYFDFSGYSEMALGLARMFNITFPANFDSPYKASNIIEFWHRWHMSLTRYLTLYVYNPIALAVTRARYAKGKPANAKALKTIGGFSAIVAFPTMVTMTLIGVWHGSGFQFLVFGLLNGFYLCVAHAWRLISATYSFHNRPSWSKYCTKMLSVALTCFCVMIAFIFFRAASFDDALRIIEAMTFWPTATHTISVSILPIFTGLNRFSIGALIDSLSLAYKFLYHAENWVGIVLAFFCIWTMPNILQIFADESPAILKSRARPALFHIKWRVTPLWATISALAFAYAILSVEGTTDFIYFRF